MRRVGAGAVPSSESIMPSQWNAGSSPATSAPKRATGPSTFMPTYRFQPTDRVTPAVVVAIRYALTFDEAGTGAQASAVNPAP